MSVIHLWNLDSQKKALLQKAIAPRCSQKKRAQYLAEAEKIQSEIFKRWRMGILAQVTTALGLESTERD
jgi:hypothetical protein